MINAIGAELSPPFVRSQLRYNSSMNPLPAPNGIPIWAFAATILILLICLLIAGMVWIYYGNRSREQRGFPVDSTEKDGQK